MFNRQNLSTKVGAAVILALPLLARAEIDLAPITAAGVSVGLVGVAVFAIMVGIKVYKWIRGAL